LNPEQGMDNVGLHVRVLCVSKPKIQVKDIRILK
jgi:hypothetical protein